MARLRSVTPRLIVLEATGGYERVVVAALAAAGLPIVVANPRQVRDFASALCRPGAPPRRGRSPTPSSSSWTR